MFGILNLDKPTGVTSRYCVDQVLKCVRPNKAGHVGTLDPIASGVLLVAIGRAVRLVEYLQRHPKTYEATFELGKESDSADTETEVREIADSVMPSKEAIVEQLPRWLGRIEQVPPAYSAVWIGGRRAYDLSRRGQEVVVPPRQVEIYALELLDFFPPMMQLRIVCGSGTYVRSLGRDIARGLGTDAVMVQLRRTHIGPFSVAEAMGLDENLSEPMIHSNLKTAKFSLNGFPSIDVAGQELSRIINGLPIEIDAAISAEELFAFDEQGRLRSILKQEPDRLWWPHKNFPVDGNEHE